mgnify:CR=1 FL=1
MADQMQNGIDKSTLKDQDQDSKLNIMIDYLFAIDERTRSIEDNRQDDVDNRKEHCKKRYEKCDNRFKKIERLYYGVIAILLVANVAVPPVVLTVWG